MAFAVELNFDPETEDILYAAWHRLAKQGLGPPPPSDAIRPHVTLSVALNVDEAHFVAWLTKFVGQCRSFDVLFQSIGLFPTAEGVVFFAPTVTSELLDLHHRFHRAQPDGWQGIVEYYTPGQWVPHCTAALGLTSAQLPDALALCMQTPLPLSGRFTALAVVEIQQQTQVRPLATLPFPG